jgi:hypothetical protein
MGSLSISWGLYSLPHLKHLKPVTYTMNINSRAFDKYYSLIA